MEISTTRTREMALYGTKAQKVSFIKVGPQYTGEFENNSRAGEGRLLLDHAGSQLFEGTYEADKKQGYGKFVSADTTLEGLDFNNIGFFTQEGLNGYGRSQTTEGMLYEGFFSDSKKEGYAFELQPNSDCYFGEFKCNKKEGVGLYLFAKGGYYYGFFKNNEKSGLGVLYTKHSHAYYFGHFESDKKSGRGTEVCKDHSVYNGFYDQNKRSGPGVMEYSNKSTYIGEWKNGVRSGKGRLENGPLVTSGQWEFDKIKFASAIDLDEIMKPFYEHRIPANIQEYIQSLGYNFAVHVVPHLTLSTHIKPVLIDLLKHKAGQGQLRGSIFKKVCNLLNSARSIKEYSESIHKAFSSVPSHDAVFSPVGCTVDYKFQSGHYKIAWHCINYDNKKTPEFTFDHLIVSSDILFGFGVEEGSKAYHLDGMCLSDGVVIINQYYAANSERQKYSCIAGPNYLTGVDQDENKVFLVPDLDMWKGFFTQNRDSLEKLSMTLYMKIYGGDLIYGFGRDKISIYMVTGKLKKPIASDPDRRKVVDFYITYEKGYTLTFRGRLDGDEIVGLVHREG